MSKESKRANSSLVPSLLLVLFIGLKLGHVIAWSWWWVLGPMWIPASLAGLVFLVVGFLVSLKGSKA